MGWLQPLRGLIFYDKYLFAFALHKILLAGITLEKFVVFKTLDKLIIAPNIETSSVNGRVVLTKGRVPGIKYSKEPSLVKKLKKLNGTLEPKTKLFEEKI